MVNFFGIFLWFISVIPIMIIYYLVPRILMIINVVVGIVVYAYFLKLTFSIRLMRDYAKRILKGIESGDLYNARMLTQEIVRRNVWDLDTAHLISAVIESLAESFVDGFLSPLFYFALFGLPGALLQRLSNTMDSMVGYRGWPYEDVGWFSARVDTVLNYIPARLSSIIISMASGLMGLNWKESILVAFHEHCNVGSVNSGWPMASFAGALGVMLEKVGAYKINDDAPGPDVNKLRLAIKLFDVSVIIALVITLALLILRAFLISLFI
ncbi:cobalamin biosynthesis protein [Vulcanisaeta sp. JCM 14467]|uniref:cobalamin biosynthesis protein n=1 Tax=Vulcanisaeta sp. JCM 14467 TaxID=1295370 RepID=UPI0020932041|nr:cobalamin biosynthesis protein [Vulcanisaeta sp. JCM 14467]